MGKIVLDFSEQEIMRIEAILMDGDREEALLFLKEVIRPKIRSKGSSELDSGKTTGIMT
ncbi:MAG: hypothetical protein JRH13_09390 [Deltaproteobacteria bacterium]|nr:hypothetical protein [Deltaproteobacteria bacterium]MBW2016954.1 hypothetical protein [Deltaproteobacteria bacterium]MBW2129563.1 hypothetical protein [Deltaproteobacteria bacterium]MBW2302434.1 hypothetical protein [Deltaproteobacteria bacterium]